MKKRTIVKGISILMAGLLVAMPLAACKKNAGSKGGTDAAVRAGAKDAVFREVKAIQTDMTEASIVTNGENYILTQTLSEGQLSWAAGSGEGDLGPSYTFDYGDPNYGFPFSNIDLASDGSIYAMANYTDYESGNATFMLLHLSPDAKELGRVQVDNSIGYTYETVCSNDGKVVVRGDNELQVFDANLKPLGKITNPNGTNRWDSIIKTAKGDLAIIGRDETGMVATILDLNGLALRDKKTVPNANGMIFSGAGYDYYISNDTNIRGVNLGDAEPTEVLNLLDSDMDMGSYHTVRMLSKDLAIIISRSSSTYEAHFGIYKKVPPSEVVDKEIITIGGFYVSSNVKTIISDFNRTNPKYRLRLVDYSVYNTEDNNYTGGQTTFRGDLTTGKAPDIIIPTYITGLEGLMAKGVFADMNPLFEKAGLNRSDYLENVLEAGSQDGKLYLLIAKYNFSGYRVKKSLLNGKSGLSLDDFMALEKQYNVQGKAIWMASRNQIIDKALYYNISDYMDLKTGKCNFDSEDFKKVLTLSNEYLEDGNTQAFYDRYDSIDYMNAGVSNQLLLSDFITQSFRDMYRNEISYFGEEAGYIGFPDLSGESKPVLDVSVGACISAKAKNKEAAFEFVKMLLSDDFQKTVDNGMVSSGGFPVSKAAFDAMAESSKEPYANFYNGTWNTVDPAQDTYSLGGKEYQYGTIPDERLEYYKSLIMSTTEIGYSEEKITNLIQEEAAPFFAGQKSVDEAAKIIQSRVSIYVQENQ